MYYALYIDVLFIRNLLLDYFLLSLLKKILKCSAGRLRRMVFAALGSAGACLVYGLSWETSWYGLLLIYAVFAAAMVKGGLQIKSGRQLGRAMFLLYLCSAGMGGIFQWLQRRLAFPVYPFLGISLVSFGVLWAGAEWLLRLRCQSRNLLTGTLQLQGRTVSVKILRDTGNCLRDPVFGKPVSIITEEVQKELCQEEVLFYAVPFRSVGQTNGMMQAFFADCLWIRTGDETRAVERPLLGITKEPLSSRKEYNMILHPELLE